MYDLKCHLKAKGICSILMREGGGAVESLEMKFHSRSLKEALHEQFSVLSNIFIPISQIQNPPHSDLSLSSSDSGFSEKIAKVGRTW